jgi:hypothetical protein
MAWACAVWGFNVIGLRSELLSIPGAWMPWLLGFAALATAGGCAIWSLRSARDPRWVARRIELKHPDLKTGLLAAVEEVASSPTGRLGFLQSAVVRAALSHGRANDWNETVPSRTLLGAKLAHAAALVALVVVLANLARSGSSQQSDLGSISAAASVADVQVDPGNTEIERGTSLLVVARFRGPVPADANLVVEKPAQPAARRGMTRSLEDPAFAGHVESVESELSYRVEFEGKSTPTYRVHVFEYPELERADAMLVFPRYTGLEPKKVEDIRHVTAVEGTVVTLLCRLNKDVARARLVDAEGKALELAPAREGNHVYTATLTLTDPRRFHLQLLDREARANKLNPEIVANVTRNQPAVVKMTQPARDVQVSPVEELTLKADLEDDFGLVRQGLSFSVAGGESREIVLSNPTPKNRRVHARNLIDFESLQAVPDQLVTYFFWAEDIGPDGRTRRTSGDMYFAEVRHFEEIFRQGDQPAGGSAENEDQEGQGDNARSADQLSQLQKEIINGTWKLIRRETRAQPTAKLADDGKVLAESQHSAIEKAGQLGARLQDAASKASLEQATRSMKEAEKHLTAVAEKSAITALNPALAVEQAAYQALLKLRAREFQIIRGNRRQRGGGGSSGGPSQRQLQQLELTDDENRYEDQRTARARRENQSQQEREQGELRQVLSRLRELAQRQTDLNERLKELQSALEAAKTEPARREIERQLKRLRDQQQQVLRDSDELRQRMESEENRDRMADARQQMEDSREHVRQASEALEAGRLSQAITEATRAGRQLNDLREQLRKGASNRFSDEMTDMRDRARRLNLDQQKLTEQLDAANKSRERSLRDTGERKQVREGLAQQRKRLDQIFDQMRRTVQDAEETEPLLAKELYDTVRKATERKIPDALEAAEQLVDFGAAEEAGKASRHAGEGIEQLRDGVERAARSVLGDELAALQRAQDELDDLADQLKGEMAQASGRPPAQEERKSNSSTRRGRDAAGDPNRQRPGTQDTPQQDGEGRQRAQGQRGQEGEQTGQVRPGSPRGERPQQGRPGEQASRRNAQRQEDQQGQQGAQAGQADQGEEEGQQPAQAGGGNQRGQQGQEGRRRLRGGNNPQGDPMPQQGGAPSGGAERQPGGRDRFAGGPAVGPGNPITGDGFRQWSDRMRDVEELLNDPEMRSEAARIRDRVRGEREEFKRHAKVPDWNRLKNLVAGPIYELRNRVAEEIRRRESPDALVPIDRDPVPPQFAEGVRRYYERLGSGQ